MLWHRILKQFKKTPQALPEASSEESAPAAEPFFRKKAMGLKLPEWLRQDWFAQRDMGMMKPPEEMAKEMEQKRNKKFRPTDEGQVFSPKRPQVAKKEVQDFLSDFLVSEPEAKPSKAKK